mmetsp:Transcript_7006/g.16759  ORF Transcript_7006/g.16759 Transcript_7006/m.16759 type:complete len:208 (-) Transcript_7006:204-827(-)|eukprot:CAMPEP_0185812526 /NCGR_PEP_ID=MMETSP1322-20130828/9390_1 /TAXON_ID=265543 /ORGANISM="Minutocellus polymorphus, Strain RCC2270" /LENGTH=207 /DNA_ID=CAMNT_0028509069 /DNA_START=63 /DNA_END=686 /DNA_ORIENTATION=-
MTAADRHHRLASRYCYCLVVADQERRPEHSYITRSDAHAILSDTPGAAAAGSVAPLPRELEPFVDLALGLGIGWQVLNPDDERSPEYFHRMGRWLHAEVKVLALGWDAVPMGAGAVEFRLLSSFATGALGRLAGVLRPLWPDDLPPVHDLASSFPDLPFPERLAGVIERLTELVSAMESDESFDTAVDAIVPFSCGGDGYSHGDDDD